MIFIQGKRDKHVQSFFPLGPEEKRKTKIHKQEKKPYICIYAIIPVFQALFSYTHPFISLSSLALFQLYILLHINTPFPLSPAHHTYTHIIIYISSIEDTLIHTFPFPLLSFPSLMPYPTFKPPFLLPSPLLPPPPQKNQQQKKTKKHTQKPQPLCTLW